MNLCEISGEFLRKSAIERYSYNFKYLGRPIIQYPQDIVAFQEVVFSSNPKPL